MRWRVKLAPDADKQLKKLDRKMRQRVWEAIVGLQGEESPLLRPNVRPLVGNLSGDCRLRVGNYRILFTLIIESNIVHVYAIVPRGSAY